ncbi:hypothetical protein [Lentilactobacillus sp. Marseille-Q4993]|uniref:hypothetical protein n=1 Tax=Lentilactobacillus sp. Marseille-Q4993 TaxID=3039492 RepID=UPI0024BD0F7E|nr:hypothetical protein [Lentilactobacillus sp. Marseille-Q4993]
MKLDKIAKVSVGANSFVLRQKMDNPNIYTNEDIDFDLSQGYWSKDAKSSTGDSLVAGDLIINLMTKKSTIVSPQSEGKIIPQNIMRMTVDDSKVYRWYICYVLNESETVKRQLFTTMEGSAIRRMTAGSVRGLDIKLPPFEAQKRLGDVYRQMLIQIRLQREYSKKINKAILTILDKNDINGGK